MCMKWVKTFNVDGIEIEVEITDRDIYELEKLFGGFGGSGR